MTFSGTAHGVVTIPNADNPLTAGLVSPHARTRVEALETRPDRNPKYAEEAQDAMLPVQCGAFLFWHRYWNLTVG